MFIVHCFYLLVVILLSFLEKIGMVSEEISINGIKFDSTTIDAGSKFKTIS